MHAAWHRWREPGAMILVMLLVVLAGSAGWFLIALGLLRLGFRDRFRTPKGALEPMSPGLTLRASFRLLRHPREVTERVSGRIDTRRDKRDLMALGGPPSEHYAVVEDWAPVLHKAI